MAKNILFYLEEATKKNPDKIMFSDKENEISYDNYINSAKSVGSYLTQLNRTKEPIVICLDKDISCLIAMMGVAYSGNFYTILDNKMPFERVDSILSTLKPIAIITDEKNSKVFNNIEVNIPIYNIGELCNTHIKQDTLTQIRNEMVDTDLLYVLFTSGSTGTPKGVAICHRSVIAYCVWLKETFDFNENTIFGSQTPFYFSMSILDVFSTIFNGATLHIVPKQLFSFPVKLLEYLKDKEVNTIYWVPSALSIVANWNAFSLEINPNLHTILFAGEVMPVKQLNVWRKAYPKALFANLFGPTEVTDICAYYILDRKFSDEDILPIGKPCNNCDIIVLTEDNKEAKQDEEGELCVRGTFLAMGYYNNPQKTEQAFIQNPLNSNYPETIYKTGDLVKYNEKGEILYLTRKDFQIKLMGYRIELGEIEAAASSADKVNSCACLFDEENEALILFYVGEIDEKMLRKHIHAFLPKYMMPRKINKLKKMPYNPNGKVDRKALKELI